GAHAPRAPQRMDLERRQTRDRALSEPRQVELERDAGELAEVPQERVSFGGDPVVQPAADLLSLLVDRAAVREVAKVARDAAEPPRQRREEVLSLAHARPLEAFYRERPHVARID